MKAYAVPAMLVALFALLALAYCEGKHTGTADTRIVAAQQSVRRSDSIRVLVHDTVLVRERAKARVDTLIHAVSETTVVIRATPAAAPETVTVRREIPMRFAADDALIAGLHADVAASQGQVRSRDSLLALPRPRSHWGLGVSGGYGPQLEHDGAIRLGWNAHLGISWRW